MNILKIGIWKCKKSINSNNFESGFMAILSIETDQAICFKFFKSFSNLFLCDRFIITLLFLPISLYFLGDGVDACRFFVCGTVGLQNALDTVLDLVDSLS